MSFKPDHGGNNNAHLKETFPFTRERQASNAIAGAVSNLNIAQIESNVNKQNREC